MKTLPKISIVIPVYNVEEYIPECLQSVMRQTYKGEIECILVDDCGNDKSVEVAERLIGGWEKSFRQDKKLEKSDCRLRFSIVHHERNGGLSAARNTGTEVATGDYIYYLDSDDYISDDCLEVLAKPLIDKNYDMIVGNIKIFGGDSALCPVNSQYDIVLDGYAYLQESFASRIPITAWNKLYNVQFLRKNKLMFEPRLLHEDIPFSYLVGKAADNIYVSTNVVYYYRIRPTSIVGDLSSNVKKECNSWMEVWNVLRSYMNATYDEIDEMVLHKYAMQTLSLCAGHGLPYRKCFNEFKKCYLFNPIEIFLQKKQSLRWLKSRMVWWLPNPLAYVVLQNKLARSLK